VVKGALGWYRRNEEAETGSKSAHHQELPVPRASTTRNAIQLVPHQIERRIFLLRGQRIMLSTDLAELYDVPAKVLNQAVHRNRERFPEDFMFRLSREETDQLLSPETSSRSQIVTLKRGSNIKHLPYAFTEQGVAMLASVLRSPRAVAVNVEIIRAFVRLRQLLATHADLARKLAELEQRYDTQFRVVFDAIRELMAPAPGHEARPEIGFRQ
jgi:hypothetical protein